MITSLFIDGALDGGELFLMSSCYMMTFMSTDFVSKRARHRPKVAARTDIFGKTASLVWSSLSIFAAIRHLAESAK
jgi:hypothetical protein